MHKGLEDSVGCSWPYTDPYLTLHSDIITTGKPNTERKLTDRESKLLFFRREQTLIP